MSQSTRLFSIWGSAGFGKTSTVIVIGNQLKHHGEYVYYFSFRGVSTMKGFTSKLLGSVGSSIDLHRTVYPVDQLLHSFGSITTQIFLILHNLDDLLTSGRQKETMLNFIVGVLQQCLNLGLLTTTRGSLEFITLRVQEFDSLKLKRTSGREVFSKFDSQIVTTTNNGRFTKPNIQNVCHPVYLDWRSFSFL